MSSNWQQCSGDCKRKFPIQRLRQFGDHVYKCAHCINNEQIIKRSKQEQEIHDKSAWEAHLWWLAEQQKIPKMKPQDFGKLVDVEHDSFRKVAKTEPYRDAR